MAGLLANIGPNGLYAGPVKLYERASGMRMQLSW
jgi:hypothetical protein